MFYNTQKVNMMWVLGTELLNDVSKVNIEIDLPANFLIELKDNDDWSFIIKTHAYLETISLRIDCLCVE